MVRSSHSDDQILGLATKCTVRLLKVAPNQISQCQPCRRRALLALLQSRTSKQAIDVERRLWKMDRHHDIRSNCVSLLVDEQPKLIFA